MRRVVVLNDGSEALVRRLRPGDAPVLAEAFEHLSNESRDLRFLAAKPELTSRDLDYLTHVDGHFHEALGATDRRTREGVGVARFVRLEREGTTAEVAVTVIDEWQNRGLGSALLELLGERALDEGIERFTALVLAQNGPIRSLLAKLGTSSVVRRGGAGTLEYEIELR